MIIAGDFKVQAIMVRHTLIISVYRIYETKDSDHLFRAEMSRSSYDEFTKLSEDKQLVLLKRWERKYV